MKKETVLRFNIKLKNLDIQNVTLENVKNIYLIYLISKKKFIYKVMFDKILEIRKNIYNFQVNFAVMVTCYCT